MKLTLPFLFTLVFIIGISAFLAFPYRQPEPAASPTTTPKAIDVVDSADTDKREQPLSAYFACADGKSITSIFYSDHVNLILSDKRELELPRAVSGSGARYANQDESIVFWDKGNTSFLEEGDINTYDNCSVAQPSIEE